MRSNFRLPRLKGKFVDDDNTVNGVNPIALPCSRALTGVHDNNFPLERIDDDIMEHVKAIASLTAARTAVFPLEASNVNNCVIKCTQTQCRHFLRCKGRFFFVKT